MVSTQGALGAAATLVAAAFALSTLERWLLRRKPHELAWTLSLAMFAVASGALWWATATGWNDVNFRIFFLFGAILNVPWLALGSIELLAPRRVVFDPNLDRHHHFIDDRTGQIHDVPWAAVQIGALADLPGFDVREYQVVMRGRPIARRAPARAARRRR